MYENRRYAELKEYLHPGSSSIPIPWHSRSWTASRGSSSASRSKGSTCSLPRPGASACPSSSSKRPSAISLKCGDTRTLSRYSNTNNPGGNPALLYQYGVALFETGNTGRAVRQLNKAIDEGRTDYEAYHYLGRAYARSGNLRLALPCLEHAQNLNEDDPDVTRSLADAYRALGRYEDSARLLRTIRQ